MTTVPEKGSGISTKQGYIRYSKRKRAFLAFCAIFLVAVTVYAIGLGDTDLSYREIIRCIFHPDDSWDSTVVWDLRLRVLLAAIVAGAALGLSGTVMQTTLRNPMASPYTLGVSSAAAFGASVAIIFLNTGAYRYASDNSGTIGISDPYVTALTAFAFAMLATGVMLAIVKLTDVSPESIVLAGMAVSSIFSALMAMMQYVADTTTLSAIVNWQFGTVERITWDEFYLVLAVTVAIGIYFFWRRWTYNAMESGEDVARGLGVNVERIRIVGLVLTAVLTSVVVAFVGIIGFVGLIAPHVVKKMIGTDNRYLIPGSALIGSIILILAFLAGNYCFSTVVPVGIITSALGGPIFIAILIGRRRRR